MNDVTTEAQDNHDRFVREVQASGLVWGLKSDQGWAVCESNEYEDTDVYPFWSDEAEARLHCADDWAGFVPDSLPLDVFIDTWLAGMSEDGVLVGTNWDAELSGLELEPDELAQELLGEAGDDEGPDWGEDGDEDDRP
ncbi:MAG: DUF2750 domain-containing protein [Bdellovibrio bacteriovorus]